MRCVHRRTFTYIHLDASILALWKYVQLQGLGGLWAAWPRPSADAWMHICVFGGVEAALLLLLPGRQHKGPITPKGNVPVYKVAAVHPPALCASRPGCPGAQSPACAILSGHLARHGCHSLHRRNKKADHQVYAHRQVCGAVPAGKWSAGLFCDTRAARIGMEVRLLLHFIYSNLSILR